MDLASLANAIHAEIVVAPRDPALIDVADAYAGDEISKILAASTARTLIVTNLAGPQVLRAAELMDAPAVCFAGGCVPDEEAVRSARKNGTALLVSPCGLFETCGRVRRELDR
jgi:hypothetical protein